MTEHLYLVIRSLQIVLVIAILIGVYRRDSTAAANAVVSLGVTFLPELLEAFTPYSLGMIVALWITGAAVLHTVGMVGLYVSVRWWDHLTHFVSASLVAGIGYAMAQVTIPESSLLIAAFTVFFTLGVGVLWELLEISFHEITTFVGIQPMLHVYGDRDAVMDLVFDAVGAIVVLALDVRVFVSFISELSFITVSSISVFVIVLVVITLILGILLDYHGSIRE